MILFLARLVRILIVLFVLRVLLRFLAAVVQGYQAAGRRPPPPMEMVRDRVCGTFLPRSRALVAVVDGHERYFCSAACRDRAAAARLPAAT